MSPVFTDFVRSLEAGLDPEKLAGAWSALGALLRQELRRRGLWHAPPAYLGIYGWSAWEGPVGPSSGDEDDPLAELTAECYSFIFLDRLPALRAQLGIKSNIDGLVQLNVRHFLHERQRRHDPLGFRVFERLQEAVLRGLAQGVLHLLAGDPAVRNDTVIGLEPTAEPEPPARDLSALVGRWNDDLILDLVAARGQPAQDSPGRLLAHLCDLPRAGILSFRFREVVDPLKNDMRARWAALLEDSGRESGSLLPAPGREAEAHASSPAVEAHDRFVDLGFRIETAIEALPGDRRTRRYLASIWRYLRSQAEAEPGVLPAEAIFDDDEWENLSHRKLSRLLDIPRARMPDLFATLQRLVEESRRVGSTRPAPRRAGAAGGEEVRPPATSGPQRHSSLEPPSLRGLS